MAKRKKVQAGLRQWEYSFRSHRFGNKEEMGDAVVSLTEAGLEGYEVFSIHYTSNGGIYCFLKREYYKEKKAKKKKMR